VILLDLISELMDFAFSEKKHLLDLSALFGDLGDML